MNKAILIGNVGADPEVRYFEGGRAVAQVRLATTERGYTLQNGVSGISPINAVKLGAIVAGLQIQKFGAIKSIPYKNEIYSIFKEQNVR